MKTALAAVAALSLSFTSATNAQDATRYTPGTWQAAVNEYNAYDRIQFKSEWAQSLLTALRNYEATK